MIGQPHRRVDGVLKVTGRATYAYEHSKGRPPVYGWIVGASIAKGRIVELDTSAAEEMAGVLLVMTHRNAPRLAGLDLDMAIEGHYGAAP
jgi:xanthine dehydrogenase YagR molybdenum-binding subunit